MVALLAHGIDLQGLWSTVVGALSLVAISFVAMWSMLSQMLASILIVVIRLSEVGDRVEVVADPRVGEVVDLNPVDTTLRTENCGTLQMPNNLFLQKAVKCQAPTALARPLLSPEETEALANVTAPHASLMALPHV